MASLFLATVLQHMLPRLFLVRVHLSLRKQPILSPPAHRPPNLHSFPFLA